MCTTTAPQSTMIHSPLSSPSIRGLAKPASRTLSRTLAAKALVWRLEVPLAMMTRSNSEDMCSVSNTTRSWALTSSKESTTARCSFWTSFLAAVSFIGRFYKGCVVGCIRIHPLVMHLGMCQIAQVAIEYRWRLSLSWAFPIELHQWVVHCATVRG